MDHRTLAALSLVFLLSAVAAAQPDCAGTSVGLVAISDLGTGTYNGWTGGLYPGGSNERPPDHLAAGLAYAAQVEPLDATGAPDPANGSVVWLSIGFSNATQEAQVFMQLANAMPDKHPRLRLVDGARGGQTATILSTPNHSGYADYWSSVDMRLANAGLTPAQVQAIWFKDDNQAGSTPLQTHYDTLLAQSKRIMNELRTRFPNGRLCYIASRSYAGYASTALNPEPYAYRNGWAMKHLIEAQITGDPALRHDGPAANAPWLSWGAYLWADGLVPRGDGLIWECPDDYTNDGTHLSPTGRTKVANLLLDFFRNDPTTCPWFLSGCPITTAVPEAGERRALVVAPNPSTGGTNVHFGSLMGGATVTVYDAAGREVSRTTRITGERMVLAREGWPSGIYLVRVEEGGVLHGTARLVVVE